MPPEREHRTNIAPAPCTDRVIRVQVKLSAPSIVRCMKTASEIDSIDISRGRPKPLRRPKGYARDHPSQYFWPPLLLLLRGSSTSAMASARLPLHLYACTRVYIYIYVAVCIAGEIVEFEARQNHRSGPRNIFGSAGASLN